MCSADGWAFLKSLVNFAVLLFQYSLFPVFIYHFTISIFGWFRRKEEPADKYAPVKRFAVVVAAHNEEKVIGSIVRNMNRMDYPRELYDVYVIADNCTDNTAEIARQNGAEVFERSDRERRGKGYALKWMFDKLFRMDKKYDAVCVFDADNLVSLNFLREMNKHLCMGHKVVQGYLDCKNPTDSLIAGSYSITYWLNNRLFQLARYYLGLNCAIGGTGFVVDMDVLKQTGWNATSLTEDLEFSIKLALKGIRIYWTHEARVYDEKPLTLAQSWSQRKRWMQGQADCACRYFKELLAKALKDRDMVAFDTAMYVIQPMIIVISGMGLMANFLRFLISMDPDSLLTARTLISALLLFVTTYIGIVIIIAEGKFTWKIAGYFLAFPFYNLTWIPIIIQGFMDRDKKEWSHTIHTRAFDIADFKQL